ncbi:MAG: xanthine dehydrogenase family protein molybdopterin-binding subunit [Steroidobacteraceae bacterium]
MNDILIVNASRRDVIKGGMALTLAVYLPLSGCAEQKAAAVASFVPNAFLRIDRDGAVTVLSKHLEMGQGSYTGLATLVAEELDADWSQVHAEGAPADTERYKNLSFGMQGTGGSTSLANSYEQYRQAGAAARAMLVTAAAQTWKVSANDIRVAQGKVTHPVSGKQAGFGELIDVAATLPVPTGIKLKNADQFTLIGKPAARTDVVAKSNGTAVFTQDFKLPGMLTAVVLHPTRFGAKVKSVDDTKARAIKNVVGVVSFDTGVTHGVAVLATNFWSAKKGREALVVEWDDSKAFKQDSTALLNEFRALLKQPGAVARNEGNVDEAFKQAARIVEASYEVPYLAHAPMEPLNCVAQLKDGACEIWNAEQFQTVDQGAVAKLLGVTPDKVKINMLYAGGSFGRRANPTSDYVLETVAIAQASKQSVPVKLVWAREDDMHGGYYRPAYMHGFKAALDKQGNITAWQHRIVGQSIMSNPVMAAMVKDGVDPSSVEGAANLPYAIDNIHVDLHSPAPGIPVLWWRSVGSSHTAYATEAFFDELARAGKQDPLQLRRQLLSKHPRHLGVLELAASKADWTQPLGKDRARGIAVHESFNSYVAQVVEVSRSGAGFKIDRVVCAVDCGLAINPNIVAMQVESAVAFALSAVLNGAITFKDGEVEQSNFHNYQVLRINQMPKVEVHIVPSAEKPTGIGEPGVPPLAPALINALHALYGKPVRTLPLSSQGLQMV